MTSHGATGEPLPRAELRPRRRVQAVWAIPAAALVVAGWLGWEAWTARGVRVVVQLDRGWGLKPGDHVRYRGTTVGEVREVRLAPGLEGIEVDATLHTAARGLARTGSRFWVVRPQLGLARVEGIETLVGPRYLAVLPGDGEPHRSFVGLSEPPAVESIQPGDLQVIITADELGSLRRGSPVTYRHVRVGTVVSAGLSSDAGTVEARVHIEQAYAPLVRPQTRFWMRQGFEARLGLTGLSLELDSIEDLVIGGVSLATPPGPGDVVRTGHRFVLEAGPPEGWLSWQPMAVIGSDMLPPGAPRPSPMLAQMRWEQGPRWMSREKSRRGWVIQTTEGLLGPADLLLADDRAEPETVELEVAGIVLPPASEPRWTRGGLTLVPANVRGPRWPAASMRMAKEPEDCLAVSDPNQAPLPLAAARLTPDGEGWSVERSVSLDASWHGAAVVARSDGHLIGLLLVPGDARARVALLPALTQ